MPKYIIYKQIEMEAPTLEEAIQNHAQGTTVSLKGELSRAPIRNDKPRSSAIPLQPSMLGRRPH
jgi:hypothetical protein